MKDWKQYICLHSFTGVVEPAYWRHTSVYILEDNRTKGLFTQLFRCCWTSLLTSHICIHIRIMSLLTQLFDIPPLCVENNKIFTQMPTTTTTTTPPPKHHRHTFVGEYLHRCPPQPPQQHLRMTSHIRGGIKSQGELSFSHYSFHH